MIDALHAELEKAGIKHICHFREANAIGHFDLKMASIVCTECRILNGEITLADVADGTINPLDEDLAYNRAVAYDKRVRKLREDGKLLWHVVYPVQTQNGTTYIRYQCKDTYASAPAEDNRICFSCGRNIDT